MGGRHPLAVLHLAPGAGARPRRSARAGWPSSPTTAGTPRPMIDPQAPAAYQQAVLNWAEPAGARPPGHAGALPRADPAARRASRTWPTRGWTEVRVDFDEQRRWLAIAPRPVPGAGQPGRRIADGAAGRPGELLLATGAADTGAADHRRGRTHRGRGRGTAGSTDEATGSTDDNRIDRPATAGLRLSAESAAIVRQPGREPMLGSVRVFRPWQTRSDEHRLAGASRRPSTRYGVRGEPAVVGHPRSRVVQTGGLLRGSGPWLRRFQR